MSEVEENFGGLESAFSAYDKAKVAILPIPFDGTSTWGKGADKGPRALIQASMNMELYDIETKSEPYRVGIFTSQPVEAANTSEMVEEGYRAVKALLDDNKFVVTLGGEHSISYPPIKAHAEKFPKMSVLQLDAHTDMRDSFHGDKHNHACVMARAKEVSDNIIQVGIRSVDKGEYKNIDESKVFYAEDIAGKTGWIEKVLNLLGDNVYITVDLDVFDPAYLPATGTPEPGGLNWYEVITLLKTVISKRNVVGFDLVELAPSPHHPASDFLAARLVYKVLGYKFCLNNK